VSADRVKPAYILKKTNRRNNHNPPAVANLAIALSSTPPQPSTKTTRSSRHIHYPSHFNI
jgi:hypothetical protein